MRSNFGFLMLALLLGSCAATAPPPGSTGASDSANSDLACQLASNCVTSWGSNGAMPLRYTGTPARAMDLLQATLRTFPEATVTRSEPLSMEVIFTTPAGFRDQVDFRIDAQAQRIDFRSRSLFGLFDFGKNRSRMQDFAARFTRQSLP